MLGNIDIPFANEKASRQTTILAPVENKTDYSLFKWNDVRIRAWYGVCGSAPRRAIKEHAATIGVHVCHMIIRFNYVMTAGLHIHSGVYADHYFSRARL